MNLEGRLECIRRTATFIEKIAKPGSTVRFDEELIFTLHRIMTDGDPEVRSNSYRTEGAQVRHTLPDAVHIVQCPPAEEVPERMARLFAYLSREPTERQAREGFKSFVQTHPFSEGNGRCGRALFALILRAGGYLADEDAVVGFLYDYFEVHRKKQRFGTLIRDIVINHDNGPWNQYFAELLPYLKVNGDRMVIPPKEGSETRES